MRLLTYRTVIIPKVSRRERLRSQIGLNTMGGHHLLLPSAPYPQQSQSPVRLGTLSLFKPAQPSLLSILRPLHRHLARLIRERAKIGTSYSILLEARLTDWWKCAMEVQNPTLMMIKVTTFGGMRDREIQDGKIRDGEIQDGEIREGEIQDGEN